MMGTGFDMGSGQWTVISLPMKAERAARAVLTTQ